MTIAVTGSMAFDYIMSFSGSFIDYILPDQLENLSISVLVDSMRRERGGTAGNIAYNLALLNQKPLIMATVGQDAAAYITELESLGIDTSGIIHLPDEFTASFFVSTDKGNRQIANFYVGAMSRAAQIKFVDQKRQDIELAIISPNVPQAMINHAHECKELNIPYVYDPSQQIPLISPQELTYGLTGAHILIVNEYEFEIIKEKTGLSAKKIRSLVEALIITQGEKGSLIYTAETELRIPAVSVTLADPTGAGDAYRAGLLAGRYHGLDWLEAGRLGTLTAAYALEEHGTQKHTYTSTEFANRYFTHFERTAGIESFFEQLR